MNRKLIEFLYFILSPILGKKIFQPIFEMLFIFSLAGMNYGQVTPKGSGELYVIQFIKEKLRSKTKLTIFDVGANLGEYTECVIKIMDKKANIYAFEPLTAASSILIKKYSKNRSVKIYNIGLSNKKQRSIIHFDEGSSQMASLHLRKLKSLPAKLNKQEPVSLKTIDKFCEDNNINYIDLLKIDVEGHELKVLQGAKNMLRTGKISYIQFEFGATMVDSKVFFHDLYNFLSPNFLIFRILQDGLSPITHYDEKKEIFLVSNYLAIYQK